MTTQARPYPAYWSAATAQRRDFEAAAYARNTGTRWLAECDAYEEDAERCEAMGLAPAGSLTLSEEAEAADPLRTDGATLSFGGEGHA